MNPKSYIDYAAYINFGHRVKDPCNVEHTLLFRTLILVPITKRSYWLSKKKTFLKYLDATTLSVSMDTIRRNKLQTTILDNEIMSNKCNAFVIIA